MIKTLPYIGHTRSLTRAYYKHVNLIVFLLLSSMPTLLLAVVHCTNCGEYIEPTTQNETSTHQCAECSKPQETPTPPQYAANIGQTNLMPHFIMQFSSAVNGQQVFVFDAQEPSVRLPEDNDQLISSTADESRGAEVDTPFTVSKNTTTPSKKKLLPNKLSEEPEDSNQNQTSNIDSHFTVIASDPQSTRERFIISTENMLPTDYLLIQAVEETSQEPPLNHLGNYSSTSIQTDESKKSIIITIQPPQHSDPDTSEPALDLPCGSQQVITDTIDDELQGAEGGRLPSDEIKGAEGGQLPAMESNHFKSVEDKNDNEEILIQARQLLKKLEPLNEHCRPNSNASFTDNANNTEIPPILRLMIIFLREQDINAISREIFNLTIGQRHALDVNYALSLYRYYTALKNLQQITNDIEKERSVRKAIAIDRTNTREVYKDIDESTKDMIHKLPEITLPDNNHPQVITPYHIINVVDYFMRNLNEAANLNDSARNVFHTHGDTLNMQSCQTVKINDIDNLIRELSQDARLIVIIYGLFGVDIRILSIGFSNIRGYERSTNAVTIPYITSQQAYIATNEECLQIIRAIMNVFEISKAIILSFGSHEKDPKHLFKKS